MFKPLDAILTSDAPVRDRETLIELLNHNIHLEHAAIVQYLQHAYAMGEGGIGTEVITIARAEMRHMKYFADLLVDLGGKPTLDRGHIYFDAPSAAAMMANGVKAEEDALREYRTQLERIDYAPLQRLLERVLADEEYHHGQFQGFEEELLAKAAEAQPDASYPSKGPVEDPEAMGLIAANFTARYNQVLEYIQYYFEARDYHARDFMEETWTWAMRGMALYADELSEHHADPAFTMAPTPVPGDLRTHVERMISLERANAATRGEQLRCPLSPELKALLKNIQSHEAYNAEMLELLKQRHLAITPTSLPEDRPILASPEPPILTGEPSMIEPPARPRPSFTVGSLINP